MSCDNVPTTAEIEQAKKDVGDFNTFMTSNAETFVDSNGVSRPTLQGAINLFGFGIAPFTFTTGGTLTSLNLLVSNSSTDGYLYKYIGAGTAPITVTAGTNPVGNPDWQAFDVIRFDDGTASSPSISFKQDSDTGIFRKADNTIGFSAGGSERMALHPNGRLTLGGAAPAAMVTATLDDGGILGSAFRARANWTGTPLIQYQNNDVMFLETYNNVTGDSENKSWAISSSNAYNNIPAGVVDSGTRLGVYGWAVSVNVPGYTHAGTLTYQAGIMGRAGFFGQAQESQSPAGAVIQNAIGVTGETYNDSPGAIVIRAKAVQALATGYTGTVEQNYAVYAQADGGTSVNYSFFGVAGEFFNLDRAHFGSSDPLALPFYETNAKIISRLATNSFEWGFPSAGGYASTIGATTLNGRPFIAFNAQFDTGNNFKTTGLAGHVIYGDNLGGLIFGSLLNQNLANQAVTESFRIDSGADPRFARRPIFASLAPDSPIASGIAGQLAWDTNYIYLCVATNTWKRAALAVW